MKNSAWTENRSGFRHVSILLKKEEKKLRIDYSCQFRQGSYSLGYFDHSVKIKAVHSVSSANCLIVAESVLSTINFFIFS